MTTAVGPTILKFVAPVIVAGLAANGPPDAAPLVVMACENAINATDVLREHVRALVPDATSGPALAGRAIFANTAVDRIVPAQVAGQGLDVTVETYFEWAIERPPFGGNEPSIPDATWVDDLAPYIERKLFTVNTGHASTAYHGFVRGISKLSDALADDAVRAAVEGVLAETKQLLVDKHEFTAGGAAGLRRQDPRAGSRTRTCRTPSNGSVGSRCASCPAPSGCIGPAAELADRGDHGRRTCWPPSRRRCPSTSRRTRKASSCSTCWQTLSPAEATTSDHRPAAGTAVRRRRAIVGKGSAAATAG